MTEGGAKMKDVMEGVCSLEESKIYIPFILRFRSEVNKFTNQPSKKSDL